jgi:hypothetical protein
MDPDRLLRRYLRQSHATSARLKRDLPQAVAALGRRPAHDYAHDPYTGSPAAAHDKARWTLEGARRAASRSARYCLLARAFLRFGPDGFARAEPNSRAILDADEIRTILGLIAYTLDADGHPPEVVGQAFLDAHTAILAHNRAANDRYLDHWRVRRDRAAKSRAIRARSSATPPWTGMPGPIG